MAPRPPSGGKGSTGKGSAKAGKSKGGSRSTAPSASRPKSKPAGKRPTPVQVKSKPGQQASTQPKKKKKRVYTDKELGLPALNMITPAGVQKPRGKKKGKIFVDDRESMMTILAIVNAEKEGQIESKMIKSRQMEEIREARKNEAEARQEKRNEKLEETKKSFKKKRPGKSTNGDDVDQENGASDKTVAKKSRKRVSFA